jgi:hypothetical protein
VSYLDLLVDLLLVRRLAPWQGNLRKRLAKSPKIDLRDSGLVHAPLGIGDREALLRHPVAGGSWEGLAIESPIAAAPSGTEAHFFQTATGAEIDLLLTLPGRPERRLAVYGAVERFRIAEDMEAVALIDLGEERSAASRVRSWT